MVFFTTKDGKLCTVAEKDNTIRFWDSRTFICEKILVAPTGCMAVIEVPGNIIISGGTERICIWERKNGAKTEIDLSKDRNKYDNYSWHCNCLSNINDNEIACGLTGSEHLIQILDLKTKMLTQTKLVGHSSKVLDILYVKEKNVLCSSSEDKTIKIWFYNQGVCLRTLSGHKNPVCGIVQWNGEFLVSASLDGSIAFWDINTGFCVKRIETSQGGRVYCVGVTREGRLLSGDANNTIAVYD